MFWRCLCWTHQINLHKWRVSSFTHSLFPPALCNTCAFLQQQSQWHQLQKVYDILFSVGITGTIGSELHSSMLSKSVSVIHLNNTLPDFCNVKEKLLNWCATMRGTKISVPTLQVLTYYCTLLVNANSISATKQGLRKAQSNNKSEPWTVEEYVTPFYHVQLLQNYRLTSTS